MIARCGFSCSPAPATASLSRAPTCASSASTWRRRRAPCDTMRLPKNCSRRCARSPQPVIAMIQGHAVGSGTIVAASCDFRIAVRTAKFGIPVAKFGFIAPVPDTLRLVQLVGPGQGQVAADDRRADRGAGGAGDRARSMRSWSPSTSRPQVEALAAIAGGQCPADDQGDQADHRNNDGAERDGCIRRTLVCGNLPQPGFQGRASMRSSTSASRSSKVNEARRGKTP